MQTPRASWQSPEFAKLLKLDRHGPCLPGPSRLTRVPAHGGAVLPLHSFPSRTYQIPTSWWGSWHAKGQPKRFMLLQLPMDFCIVRW